MLDRREMIGGMAGTMVGKRPRGRFGVSGKFTAKPGQRDALLAILLEAADGMAGVKGCQVYIVGTAPDDPDGVYVTEVWDSKEDHAASLKLPGTPEMIAKARPLIAGMEGVTTTPLAGVGLR